MTNQRPNLIPFPDTRSPSGPDGKGWNRLAIHTFAPKDRCKLRPVTRQAALDLGRGMALLGEVTTFAACERSACEGCQFNQNRDPWVSTWILSEDANRGGIWLMGSTAPDAFGHYYPNWEALAQAVEIPTLTRVLDPHWGRIYTEAPGSAAVS